MGILIEDNRLLLVNHRGLSASDTFWNPPGGGAEVGETLEEALAREWLEETGLNIVSKRFLFVNEVITSNLHAIECFFEIAVKSGVVKTGEDPEHDPKNQLIKNVAFLSFEELIKIPKSDKHNVLHKITKIEELLELRGYSAFRDIR